MTEIDDDLNEYDRLCDLGAYLDVTAKGAAFELRLLALRLTNAARALEENVKLRRRCEELEAAAKERRGWELHCTRCGADELVYQFGPCGEAQRGH